MSEKNKSTGSTGSGGQSPLSEKFTGQFIDYLHSGIVPKDPDFRATVKEIFGEVPASADRDQREEETLLRGYEEPPYLDGRPYFGSPEAYSKAYANVPRYDDRCDCPGCKGNEPPLTKCRNCGEEFEGLASHGCPECGFKPEKNARGGAW
jgi:hypothetical protein